MTGQAALAYIAGAYEHPTRLATDKSLYELHADSIRGALADAGLSMRDVDALYCANAGGLGPISLAEYLGIHARHYDSTDIGGAAYVLHVGHAAEAIAAGRCKVAVISLAGRPRADGIQMVASNFYGPEDAFEAHNRAMVANLYGLAAARHMYEYGTTSEQLAWVKVAASHHAQHNPNALLREVVTVEDVVNSPVISDPLRRLDSCVITDGGGALIVVSPEIMASLKRPAIAVRGWGEAVRHLNGGHFDMTTSGAVRSGRSAYEMAGIGAKDIKYASIYDSFTITALIAIEDLGFCEKGRGGAFVSDGNLISGIGTLPFNTDGGGLCSNHPGNRGGMTKVIEAVRQLRGEAHPAVQVANCDLALAHGTGGWIATRHGSATVILERQ